MKSIAVLRAQRGSSVITSHKPTTPLNAFIAVEIVMYNDGGTTSEKK